MINGLAHVALYTNQFEETICFYERVFEAQCIGRFTTDRNACWLKIGDSILEIFESEQLPAEGTFKHIAFSCDQLDAAFEHAIQAGAKAYIQPKDVVLNMTPPKALRIAFIKGINDEQIELCSEH